MSLFPETAGPGGTLHAHCDGGSRGNPGPAGYGAVVTDEAGRKLAELSEFLGTRTNNFAEYSGLLAVLDWTLANGHRRLSVVSDSLLMVNQVKGRFKVNSPELRPLWQGARDRIARLERFEITHALRHKNKDADALANAAMDRGTGKPAAGRPGADRAQTGLVESLPLPPQPAVPAQVPPRTQAAAPAMLRGYVKEGVVHLLGSARLADGIFVKIVPE